MHFVDRVVEHLGLCGGFVTHLDAERAQFVGEFGDAIAPLIQKRNQLGLGLAEDLPCQRRFLRAIGHRLEAFGQIEQHGIGAA